MRLKYWFAGLLAVGFPLLLICCAFHSERRQEPPAAHPVLEVRWIVEDANGALLSVRNVSPQVITDLHLLLEVTASHSGFVTGSELIEAEAAHPSHKIGGVIPDLSPTPREPIRIEPGAVVDLIFTVPPVVIPAPLHAHDGAGDELPVAQYVEGP